MTRTGDVLDPESQQHFFTVNDCTASLNIQRNPLQTSFRVLKEWFPALFKAAKRKNVEACV